MENQAQWTAYIPFKRKQEMKKDYWNVSDEQVFEKTGKPLSEWNKILHDFDSLNKKSNDVVKHLQTEFNVPRYWARTLTTRFTREQNDEL